MNPFERRVTEYIRDPEAFLSIVSPEPITAYLEGPAREDGLYDRLALIIGSPGSGKTTIATTFEFNTVSTLLRNSASSNYSATLTALTKCRVIRDDVPAVLATRIPAISQFREIWEFPYPEEIRAGLATALIQARTVLAWFRQVRQSFGEDAEVRIHAKPDSNAALLAIGGPSADGIKARAQELDQALYDVSAALIPPAVKNLPEAAISAYRPFDVIESISISFPSTERVALDKLKPLAILDDAHELHPSQLRFLSRWLANREMSISRWILMRFDALKPLDAFLSAPLEGMNGKETPGFQSSREITRIFMQGAGNASSQRRIFRKTAADMSGRYLRSMTTFGRRQINSLVDFLATEPTPLTNSKLGQLRDRIENERIEFGVSQRRFDQLGQDAAQHLSASTNPDTGYDVQLAIIRILLHRYVGRVPQASLFEEIDPEPAQPVSARSGVADGARIHLMHEFERPYYFGFDSLAYASTENAEMFLRLAATLVDAAETRLIRGRPVMLDARSQDRALRTRAREIHEEGGFPESALVRRLTQELANICLVETMKRTAPLGGGANSIGVPQEEFDLLANSHPRLAQVLHFGTAYNAFTIRPRHKTKNRLWCLIELAGPSLIHYGLTLRRGGFVESHVSDLAKMIDVDQS